MQNEQLERKDQQHAYIETKTKIIQILVKLELESSPSLSLPQFSYLSFLTKGNGAS